MCFICNVVPVKTEQDASLIRAKIYVFCHSVVLTVFAHN